MAKSARVKNAESVVERILSHDEVVAADREAFDGVCEFLACMSDEDRTAFCRDVATLNYPNMNYNAVMAAMTLARSTVIRVMKEFSARG